MLPKPVFIKIYILFGILIVLLDGFECQPISENFVRFISAIRSNKGKELQLRREDQAYDYYDDIYARKIPSEGAFLQEEYPSLSCFRSYRLANERYVYFDLDPYFPEELSPYSCTYTFIGSQKQQCTTGIYCSGIISYEQKPNARMDICENGFLSVSDGTEGRMRGCGDFSFHNTPRYPRNGGNRMTVKIYKPVSNTKCIAFCIEDLQPGMYGLKPSKPLSLPEPPPYGVSQEWKISQVTHSKCKCGIRGNRGRVVGGDAALKNEFPWIAALVYPRSRKPFCGGSLINSRYILTAGHCFAQGKVSTRQVEVVLHAHVLDQNPFFGWDDPTLNNVPGWNLSRETDESEKSIRVKVVEILVHPMFDGDTFDYDFALLKLAQPVSAVGSNVAPICLPMSGQKTSYQDGKTVMTVAGWGVPWEDGPATSRLLQKLDVPYVSNRVCRRYTLTTDTHICAGYLQGGKDACSGDSGGPLIYLTNPHTNQYVQSGVVSAGAGCARQGQLGLYSEVEEVIPWIQDNASDGTWCAR